MTKTDKRSIIEFLTNPEVLWLNYEFTFNKAKCHIEATFRSGYIRIVAMDVSYKEAKMFIKQVKKRKEKLSTLKYYSDLINEQASIR